MFTRIDLAAILVCSAAAIAAAPLALAQAPQQPGGGGQTPGGASGRQPAPQQQGPAVRMPQRATFISGRVVMEDGTPPPSRTVIQRSCSGTTEPEGYTDAKGRFGFQLGGESRLRTPDASVGARPEIRAVTPGRGGRGGGRENASGEAVVMESRAGFGCEITAYLPGYRSNTVVIGRDTRTGQPDIGVLVLRRIGETEGNTISFSSLDAPDKARKAYEKGIAAGNEKKWDRAQQELEKAVGIYPKYAAAWYELGFALHHQNRVEQARKAYAQAVQADPRFTKPYLQLALIAARESNWQEVADTTGQVIRLSPAGFPQAYFLNAIAHLNLNNSGLAEKSARAALEREADRQYPQVRQVLGIALSNRGDYAGAIEQLEAYLKLVPEGENAERTRRDLADLRQRVAQRASPPQD